MSFAPTPPDRESGQAGTQTVRKRRKEWNLPSTRKTGATWQMVEPMYFDLRGRYPNMGARGMVARMRLEYGMKVPEELLIWGFWLYEPDAVLRRKRKRFRRKRYWAAGVMDIVCFDQHDKWKRFGLWLHIGLDPFTGRILWLSIWWTNRNPRLITSYFLRGCRRAGGIPLITQSDLGSENYGYRQLPDHHAAAPRPHAPGHPAASLDEQESYERQAGGCLVSPEAPFHQSRMKISFDAGVSRGLLNILNPLEKLVFRWLAVPWIQKELDEYVRIFNATSRRKDKHKILPQGIPDLIASKPQQYGATDYKVRFLGYPRFIVDAKQTQVVITPELFDELDATWAPSDDPVFQLVPPSFQAEASVLYEHLGSPEVTLGSFWHVYVDLLNALRHFPTADSLHRDMDAADDNFEDNAVELMAGQADLREGAAVVGNLAANAVWLHRRLLPAEAAQGEAQPEEEEEGEDLYVDYAEFTDDEPVE
ncbi:hypothetical protein C8F04DRAFT_1180848 [Mycena alexandri]|uniref:Integrase catalytic domain-containing protein n=1 Tax=Mycena alexandri TaxID=1745969 RepID=A0AAD6X6V4_9AGAR|nr:hypothetical protein C8F04DRAFT_1180848 [Mycena alexandri]